VSHTHSPTSLRVVLTDPYGSDNIVWTVTDPLGNPDPSVSLRNVVFQSEFALSPDGQSIAYLTMTADREPIPVPITVIDETGSHELDFKATEIRWGAIDYAFTEVPPQG
jgi:hypothetical protein